LRFYDPTTGRVLFDGVDIRHATLASLRGQIGVVTQSTTLFHDTVRGNIGVGRPEASLSDIIEAAKAANAHQFIQRLPKGYDTVIGERGETISGGERQRLALARALLKNPAILILDEATSQLDSESEHLITEALERLCQGRTVLLIAHRLSTVRLAHRIVVIQEGRIVEQGSHEDLLKHSVVYRRLCELQLIDVKEGMA
jgi:subfamily B ATP-binding cassette protein MsbA